MPTLYHLKVQILQENTKLMRSKLETVRSDNTIKEVAEKFVESEYHSLPVVDDGILVGILTTTDLIKYLLQHH